MSAHVKRIVLRGQLPETRPVPFGAAAMPRVFLLSPAHAGGRRATMLLRTGAMFDLAYRLQASGIPLGEAFSFMSPLYFRGKLAYAQSFANPPSGVASSFVITPTRGLLEPGAIVGLEDLCKITDGRVDMMDPKYRDPLDRDLARLSEQIGPQVSVVLLGSIATRKYIPLLREALGSRLAIPRDFIGLGNMSRGALLLRCVRERSELEYISAARLQT